MAELLEHWEDVAVASQCIILFDTRSTMEKIIL
jgi:hypothetical protein